MGTRMHDRSHGSMGWERDLTLASSRMCATTTALQSCLHRRAVLLLELAVATLYEAEAAHALRQASRGLSRQLQRLIAAHRALRVRLSRLPRARSRSMARRGRWATRTTRKSYVRRKARLPRAWNKL